MLEKPVLVVFEDSDPDITLLRLSLDTHLGNYELVRADDGERALAIVVQAGNGGMPKPDLFLIDINLPKLSGLELLDAIRSMPRLTGIPVVVLSSSESPRDREAVEALGVTAFVSKPMSLDEFMDIGGVLKDLMLQNHRAVGAGK